MEKQAFVIGIVGGSGSGKTTLLSQIRQRYSESQVCTLNMDDYYYPREAQHVDPQGVTNFDLPTALDDARFVEDLRSLMGGETLEIKEYTFNNPKAQAATKSFNPAPVIVIEGLFLFAYTDLSSLLDFKVYVYVREALRLIRRIRRDQTERNYPLEDVIYRFEHHVLPSHDQFIEPFRANADLEIVSDDGQFQNVSTLYDLIDRQLRL